MAAVLPAGVFSLQPGDRVPFATGVASRSGCHEQATEAIVKRLVPRAVAAREERPTGAGKDFSVGLKRRLIPFGIKPGFQRLFKFR